MYILGENIHIISEKVKEALANKDAYFFQDLAVKQVEAGAQALDLNLGPRKKDGEVVFPWMVETVQAVVDVPLASTALTDGREPAEEDQQSPADRKLHLG
jgi:cobalamin-dependent methionine synthase I